MLSSLGRENAIAHLAMRTTSVFPFIGAGIEDSVGNAVGLGAEVLSEIGGFELVVLHHRQVIVQKIVVAS